MSREYRYTSAEIVNGHLQFSGTEGVETIGIEHATAEDLLDVERVQRRDVHAAVDAAVREGKAVDVGGEPLVEGTRRTR